MSWKRFWSFSCCSLLRVTRVITKAVWLCLKDFFWKWSDSKGFLHVERQDLYLQFCVKTIHCRRTNCCMANITRICLTCKPWTMYFNHAHLLRISMSYPLLHRSSLTPAMLHCCHRQVEECTWSGLCCCYHSFGCIMLLHAVPHHPIPKFRFASNLFTCSVIY